MENDFLLFFNLNLMPSPETAEYYAEMCDAMGISSGVEVAAESATPVDRIAELSRYAIAAQVDVAKFGPNSGGTCRPPLSLSPDNHCV